MTETVEALVDGGKASAGPPLGPALGPMGVNIMQVINAINEKTKNFEGMKVPVKILIDSKTKDFKIEIGTPPAASLIIKEIGCEKGSGSALKHKVGDLSIEQAIKVAKMKEDGLLGQNLKMKTKEIIGTCQSIGVTVEGKPAKQIQDAIDNGEYDSKFT
jgi:large subunit ribosomal protein L11